MRLNNSREGEKNEKAIYLYFSGSDWFFNDA
jgi:hypothetical protein